MIKKKKQKPMTKTGLPLLSNKDDLTEIFTGEKSAIKPEQNFSDLLNVSLSKENLRDVLREKQDGLSQKKELTINEILKSYPPPQDEIDLHGCSVDEAKFKTETFIKAARGRGVRTLRVIVGKGIHSQGKAVLPDAVESKIVDLKQNKLVLTFKWENNSRIKGGVLIVYL